MSCTLNFGALLSVEIIQLIEGVATVALDHLDVAHKASGYLLVLIHQIDLDLHPNLRILADGKGEQVGHIFRGIQRTVGAVHEIRTHGGHIRWQLIRHRDNSQRGGLHQSRHLGYVLVHGEIDLELLRRSLYNIARRLQAAMDSNLQRKGLTSGA